MQSVTTKRARSASCRHRERYARRQCARRRTLAGAADVSVPASRNLQGLSPARLCCNDPAAHGRSVFPPRGNATTATTTITDTPKRPHGTRRHGGSSPRIDRLSGHAVHLNPPGKSMHLTSLPHGKAAP
jgi:hypothetical protein